MCVTTSSLPKRWLFNQAASCHVFNTTLCTYHEVYILPCYRCVVHEYIYYPVTDALSTSIYITLLPMRYPRVYILPCYRCVVHEYIYYPVTDALSTSIYITLLPMRYPRVYITLLPMCYPRVYITLLPMRYPRVYKWILYQECRSQFYIMDECIDIITMCTSIYQYYIMNCIKAVLWMYVSIIHHALMYQYNIMNLSWVATAISIIYDKHVCF